MSGPEAILPLYRDKLGRLCVGDVNTNKGMEMTSFDPDSIDRQGRSLVARVIGEVALARANNPLSAAELSELAEAAAKAYMAGCKTLKTLASS